MRKDHKHFEFGRCLEDADFSNIFQVFSSYSIFYMARHQMVCDCENVNLLVCQVSVPGNNSFVGRHIVSLKNVRVWEAFIRKKLNFMK